MKGNVMIRAKGAGDVDAESLQPSKRGQRFMKFDPIDVTLAMSRNLSIPATATFPSQTPRFIKNTATLAPTSNGDPAIL